MKRKTIVAIIITALFTAFSGFLSYLSSSSVIFDEWQKAGIIGQNVDILTLKDWALRLSIAIQVVGLSLPSAILKYKNQKLQSQRDSLIANIKGIMSDSLALPNNAKFDVRIFLPKNPKTYRISKALFPKHARLKFGIKNIDYLCETGTTDKLEFAES